MLLSQGWSVRDRVLTYSSLESFSSLCFRGGGQLAAAPVNQVPVESPSYAPPVPFLPAAACPAVYGLAPMGNKDSAAGTAHQLPTDVPGLVRLSPCHCAHSKIHMFFSAPSFTCKPNLAVRAFQPFLAPLTLLSGPQRVVGLGLARAGDGAARLHTPSSAPAQPRQGLPANFIFN